MNFLLIILVLFYTVTLSYSRQINSVFLAAFDPLYSVSGAYKRLNRDFTSLSDKFAKNSEAHSDTAQTESNKGNDIEYVEPTSSENPEIQKLGKR
ncbi:uncharacterized protein CMU_015290 [Cryptosporidium muris RN66]|uniref:Signal peptide-containing protein n=1 Tax=Cryptosporidium muris (strain RN66) TaxID=441375 RepID=B6AEA6_CRYMR|nr:uncharacterized protein CMU_015290 [Cryptosporidium muris RN66]EEA06852.1 hypothetical protein CMU_015290 [Cryptosporidium muris RN66]|eukprot:XP_002141201.1 hypothetical protein [Cryptosporidium muris RN66]